MEGFVINVFVFFRPAKSVGELRLKCATQMAEEEKVAMDCEQGRGRMGTYRRELPRL